ncbi:VanZ family protein [Microbacterium sp. LS_15]|uniref:VanZ family protein n=1 Tax=Microbacterium sp. LS_15 TaxID=3055790 RepID=UPI0035C0C307
MVDLAIVAVSVFGGIAFTVWRLRRGDRFTVLRLLSGVAASVYFAALIALTFLPLRLEASEYEKPWWIWVNVVPFQDIVDDPVGLTLNVALFVPLGLLAPVLLRTSTWLRAALLGLLVSGTIEIVQFIGDVTVGPGRVADIDDLITNVLGTVIGYLVLRLAIRVPAFRRVARLLSWPAPGTSEAVVAEDLDDGGGSRGSRAVARGDAAS